MCCARLSRLTQVTVYDEAGQWTGNYGATGQPLQQAIWLDNYPVALINAASAGVPEVAYVQPDHLGTPRVVIDPVRDVAIWEWSSKSEVFATGSKGGPYIYPDRIAEQALAGLFSHASQLLPLLKPFWMQNQKDGSASKSDNCPTGTLPIDKAKKPFGLDHDAVETIKESAGVSPRTWTVIAPNGDIGLEPMTKKGRKESNIGEYGYGN